MEANREYLRSVHVLRHSFRPSEALAENLRAFTNTKPGYPTPRFVFSSVYGATINSEDYVDPRYAEKINGLSENFQRKVGQVGFKSVAYSFKTAKAGPNNPAANSFNLLFTLDDESMAAFAHPVDELGTFKDVLTRSPQQDSRFLMLRITEQQLASEGTVAGAWRKLRNSIEDDSTGLYTVYPDGLTGNPSPDWIMRVIAANRKKDPDTQKIAS